MVREREKKKKRKTKKRRSYLSSFSSFFFSSLTLSKTQKLTSPPPLPPLSFSSSPPPSVLSIQSAPGVERNSLALNAVQRRSLRLSSGDTATAVPFHPPRDAASFAAALVQAEVDFVSRRPPGPKGTPPAAEIDAGELGAHLCARFAGQIFTSGQQATFEFQGVNFAFKVLALATPGPGGRGAADAPRAMLAASSAFAFEVAPGASLALRGQRGVGGANGAGGASTSGVALFKAKDFNFEKLGIGGLDAQFEQIFRRAFASRVFPPSVVARLGIKHVRGVLLFGPPGTGKTLIARQIGKMLNGREPKVVNGPEVLNKYVGASEENVRNLFKDAEEEQLARGADSDLHVIIFDEIDAICKARGSAGSGAGGGVHDTVVNQLLTKIDGVDALDNILLIGMTNRKDMLDDALLRPGRLEVQVEVGLPDERGRLQILKIHTSKMAASSYLAADVDLAELAAVTKNFSGAEIEGLVKSAASFALARNVDMSDLTKAGQFGSDDPESDESLKVTAADFRAALDEVVPAFGAPPAALRAHVVNGMLDCGAAHGHLRSTAATLVEQTRHSAATPLLTCLLEGFPGAGKTALAATVGLECGFPLVRLVSPDSVVGFGEAAKAQALAKAFDDAYKSPLSLIILDDIERLLEYVAIGPRFSNVILQTLLVLLKKPPPAGRRLLVLGTTSEPQAMADLGAAAAFNVALNVPRLREPEARTVLVGLDAFAPEEVDMAIAALMEPEVPIKRLLMLLEMARQARDEGGGRVSVPSSGGEGMAVDGAAAAASSTPALGHGSGGRIPIHHWNAVLRDLATG